jgi:transposase
MHHIIYKTTCTVTGKYYIGMHSSKKEVDHYLGSGNILRASIKKHSKGNHYRETIAVADTREKLRQLEAQLVTKELLLDPLCMNLAIGGCGSGVGRIVTEKTRLLHSKARKGWAHMRPEVRERRRRELSETQKARVGDLSPRSKTWTLLSPAGEVFVTKAMTDFCAAHHLSYSALRNRSRENNTLALTKGPSKGWSVLSCV